MSANRCELTISEILKNLADVMDRKFEEKKNGLLLNDLWWEYGYTQAFSDLVEEVIKHPELNWSQESLANLTQAKIKTEGFASHAGY